MGRDCADLHDPNAEYTMRELPAETMGVRAKRGDGRDVEITVAEHTVEGETPFAGA
jgi:gluconate/galactonate dehydratase